MSVSSLLDSTQGTILLIVAMGAGIWQIIQYRVNKTVEDRLLQLETKVLEELSALTELVQTIDKRTDRTEYALYNDGKTGLINKVDCLVENQQKVMTDVAVLKAKRGK